MPRPRKCRRVCALPPCMHFAPSTVHDTQPVVMTVDEYETIRLIDLEGLTQAECARQMEVARTTAQAIYASARKKLAQCITQSRPMNIAGGDIRVCQQHGNPVCGCCCGRFTGIQNRKDAMK